MNSIVIVVIFASCCIACFLGGALFEHFNSKNKSFDGKLIVKKTSDDEITTLFELAIKPEDLLTKDSFWLKVIQKE